METLVTYRLEGSVATITMDDGKVNAMSLRMITALAAAFDRAAADRAVVVLQGRPGVFCAGFDLPTLRGGVDGAIPMLRGGFELAHRMLSFPYPVAIACTGHAVAMGLFLLLSGDYRIGVAGPYQLTANEVAIGLTMPGAAVEILRQRLAPAYFNRAVTLAERFSTDNAVEAGLLDRVVEPSALQEAMAGLVEGMCKLDMAAHAGSKLRARQPALDAIRTAIAADFGA